VLDADNKVAGSVIAGCERRILYGYAKRSSKHAKQAFGVRTRTHRSLNFIERARNEGAQDMGNAMLR